MSMQRRSTSKPVRSGESLLTGMKDNGRKRRNDLANVMASGPGSVRNDILPQLELVHLSPNALNAPGRNVRAVDSVQVRRIMNSIARVGFIAPVLIDQDNQILNGVAAAAAAKALGLVAIPCIRVAHLTASEKRVVRPALNRLSEKGHWALPELKAELIELVDEGIEIEDTAFTLAEFDQITLDDEIEPAEQGPLAPDCEAPAVAQLGDVFVFDGGHRVVCGDATDPEVYRKIFGDETARLVLTDEPYNVPIAGHVTKGDHREFAMASGEMTDPEFSGFNSSWMGASLAHLCDGGLIGTFIDWRGFPLVHAAAFGHGLVPINLCVWAKTNGGLGSLYRSQHELFPLYKKGTAAHVNNIELGKHGRWRSNLWSYPGASSVSSDSRKGLELHPTVKPTALLTDAMLDLTNRGDIVLDPFLGSGSALIAAHGTGRRCFGIELDPRYVDVVLKRSNTVCGLSATLEATGETFDGVATRRHKENLKAS
jgi:DNA modification methylase